MKHGAHYRELTAVRGYPIHQDLIVGTARPRIIRQAHRPDFIEDQHGVHSCTLVDSDVLIGVQVGLQPAHNSNLA